MNTHPHGEQISAYLDGMLDVARTRDMVAHLRLCTSCRTAAEEVQSVKGMLRGMSVPASPSPEFWSAAYRRLRVADYKKVAPRGFQWALPSRRWAAGVAAVAVMGAMLVAPLYRTPTDIIPTPISTPAQDLSPDVSALVQAHTDSVARLPLADPDRQTMIAADVTQSSQAGMPEAAGYADSTY